MTERQRQIAQLAALGVTNAEIAIALGLTAAGVQAELEAFYREPDGGDRRDGGEPRLDPTERSVK